MTSLVNSAVFLVVTHGEHVGSISSVLTTKQYKLTKMVQLVTSLAEFQAILSSNPKVMVDFYATWCGPCKAISPQVEAFEKEFSGIKFLKVDVDENGETAENCKVSAMPTFKFYLNGKEDSEVVGASADKLKAALQALDAK